MRCGFILSGINAPRKRSGALPRLDLPLALVLMDVTGLREIIVTVANLSRKLVSVCAQFMGSYS